MYTSVWAFWAIIWPEPTDRSREINYYIILYYITIMKSWKIIDFLINIGRIMANDSLKRSGRCVPWNHIIRHQLNTVKKCTMTHSFSKNAEILTFLTALWRLVCQLLVICLGVWWQHCSFNPATQLPSGGECWNHGCLFNSIEPAILLTIPTK